MAQPRETTSIAYSAAAIYGGAATIGLVEGAIPGGPPFSMAPSVGALILTLLTFVIGPRLSRRALAPLGPLGAAMIAVALATTHGYTDAAVFYMWPALWMAHFYGRAGTVFIVAWIGIVQGVALASMPDPEMGNFDRWIDVVGSVLVVAAVVRVLTARREELVARLTSEARLDPLTGLLNRRGFRERMDVEVARAVREQHSLAAIAIDIDHFKLVNDDHGHDVGDGVLAWLGATIREQVRGVDVAARQGGEEFVVVMPGGRADAAFAAAERIRAAVAAGGGPTAITVSAGIAVHDAPVDEPALLAAADEALYAAKRAGRDRTVAHAAGVAA
jgi:diguanylate cyclase (GGDEF)-like protein